MVRIFSLSFLLTLSLNLFSQNKIRENDILFKQTLTRNLPMSNLDNMKVFGKDNLLIKVLLEAFSKGQIEGYENNQLLKKVSYCESISLIKPEFIYDDELVNIRLFKEVELTEDVVFDNKHSDVVLNPTSITVMISPEYNHLDLLQPFVSFRYSDCAKIFKKDSRALAINPMLNGRNINFNEVFLMHLYTSYISKIGSPNDSYFDQMKSDKMQAFLYGKEKEQELNDYLYKLFNPR